MITRVELEKREHDILASYAAKSDQSKGRQYGEEEHPYRSIYQRDKDRIVYSNAFRRLEYKTQVFVNNEGDYYRTRLTHTLEVVQIARAIARGMRLNEELVEAIALAHDLGHTPFGHAGETALNEIMAGHGGFEHNKQGLRVVDILEKRYPDFPGLNLTYEVREGIAKHNTTFDNPEANVEFPSGDAPSLEAQVVDLADEIAYDNHDMDDGLKSGLLDEKDLHSVLLWSETEDKIRKDHPSISDDLVKMQITKSIINEQVSDVIENTELGLKEKGVKDAFTVRRCGKKLVSFSEKMSAKRGPLRQFLIDKLYRHYRVIRMSDKAMRFIKSIFDIYINKPEQLPESMAARLKGEDKFRVICDYIAGMTDRYALDEYKKFFVPYERV